MRVSVKKINLQLLIIIFLSAVYIPTVYAANRLLYENFDDQIINDLQPQRGGMVVLAPPQYNLQAVGRGGNGFCFSSGTVNEAFLLAIGNAIPNPWPTDEMYVSFWLRYPTFTPTVAMENIKLFYPHWNGTQSYLHYSMVDAGGVYYSAKGNGVMVSQSNWLNTPNQTDGNWHHYEFYVKFSEGISRFWYDGSIKVDHKYNGTNWLPNNIYYIAIGSIDAESVSIFSRQFDEVEIWDGMPGTSSTPPPSPVADSLPTVSIQSPTTQSAYSVATPTVNIAGIASDDKVVQSVSWANDRGGGGAALNVSGTFSNWAVDSISLLEGINNITVTVTDSAGQKTAAKIAVTYATTTPGFAGFTQTWAATAQAGTISWTDSTSTWCVRLLVKGANLVSSGNQIRLGFQGRKSGSYTVQKVSIAERDLAGGEGDIIDSTWARVTFDGRSAGTWGNDAATVFQGVEKVSDPISFPIQTGKDYYVTFLMGAPSTYLVAPSGNREMYFDGIDHADDLDWSANGHLIFDQRIHGLGSVLTSSAPLLGAPTITTIKIQ